MLEIQPEPVRLSEHGARGNAYLTNIEVGYYDRPEEHSKAIAKRVYNATREFEEESKTELE